MRELRVAELKKSTRHRYTPPSVSWTFLIWSRAFLLLLSSMAKNRRSPKSFAIAECAPNLTFRSRESMLLFVIVFAWYFNYIFFSPEIDKYVSLRLCWCLCHNDIVIFHILHHKMLNLIQIYFDFIHSCCCCGCCLRMHVTVYPTCVFVFVCVNGFLCLSSMVTIDRK